MGESKPYVLLVEDDPGIAQLTVERLRDLGCEIKSVTDTQAARAAIKERVPALMLLDYKLPGESGLEFVQNFRARGEVCPPFIVMTGHSGEEVAVAMLRAGARDYLVKGVSFFDPLKSSVKRVLDELESARRMDACSLALKDSEEKTREAQRLARFGSWNLDVTTGDLTWSEEYYRLFGLDPKQPPSGYEERLKVYAPESAARLDAAVKSTMRTGEPYELDLEFAHPQGECLWVSVLGAATHNAQGQIVGLHGSVQDITARKKTENDLHEKEYILSESQRLGHIGSWFYKMKKALIWSEEMYRLYGVSPDTFTPTVDSLVEVMHPEDRLSMKAWIADCAAGKNPDALEYRAIMPDGKVRFLVGTGKLVSGDGETYMAGTVQNITERKLAEAERLQIQSQLLQSQKMEAIGVLAGGVAHDFNNILTAIIGYGGFLRAAIPAGDPKHADLDEIINAGERAAVLTHQLLIFSRKQAVQFSALNLDQVIPETIKMLRRMIPENVEFNIYLQSAPATVLANHGQLEQVVMNLAVNARDAMPNGGKLTFETAQTELDKNYASIHPGVTPGRYVMLAVSDTGSGMSPNVVSHLFEPFFTTKDQGKGTGLGLSTTYGIVKKSGGSIFVYSKPGKGTTFKVYLPIASEKAGEKPTKRSPVVSYRGTETILLVEDEAPVRKFVSRLLSQNGYSILEAATPKEAIALCESRHDIPLMLTDMVMPQMDGYALAKTVTALAPMMKVIFMSGYTDNALTQQNFMKPGTELLEKPLKEDVILRKVREVLDGEPK